MVLNVLLAPQIQIKATLQQDSKTIFKIVKLLNK